MLLVQRWQFESQCPRVKSHDCGGSAVLRLGSENSFPLLLATWKEHPFSASQTCSFLPCPLKWGPSLFGKIVSTIPSAPSFICPSNTQLKCFVRWETGSEQVEPSPPSGFFFFLSIERLRFLLLQAADLLRHVLHLGRDKGEART